MGYFLCAESWEYLGFFRTHINYARFTKEHWKLREREIRIAFCTLREILSRFQRFEATKTNIRARSYSLLCAILNICVYACFRVEQRWTQQYLMYFIFRSISQWRFNKWSTAQCAVFDLCICDTYDYNTSGNLLFCKRKIFYGFSKYRFALNSIFYCHHGKLNWVAAKKVLHILYQKHI